MQIQNRRRHHALEFAFALVSLLIAWECTIHLRFLLNPYMGIQFTEHQARASAPSLATICILWGAVVFRLRLYRSADPIRFWSSVLRIADCTIVVGFVTALATFFPRQLGVDVSRSFVLVLMPVGFIMFSLSHMLSAFAERKLEKSWPSNGRVALLGDAQAAARLLGRIRPSQVARHIQGLILPPDSADENQTLVPVLGTTNQLAELINREQLDRIIFLNGGLSPREMEACHQVVSRMGVTVGYAVDFATEPMKIKLSTQYGIPFVEMVPIHFTRTQEILKRCFDIAVSGLALFVLLPILLIIALIVRLSSEGPVLYNSLRVGRGGRYFLFLKFRSMYTNADRLRPDGQNEKTGHIYKVRNDPRVTPIGQFLRRYSLDELPQLINVLRGEMSLVGPRPLPAKDLDPDGMSREFSAWAEGRSGVHPGITGLWQIRGRSDLSFEEMVELDLEYIQNWSLALDIKIILETPGLVLKGSGAY